ncbi:hypothetical protein Pdca_51590 [Pseudonocardia autotrophica]|nr:hypothetical protein Pdca_51590 [Pseudonocardia autotrophica]
MKTYTAWVSEADQRAATGLGTRMPKRPTHDEEKRRATRVSEHPYEHLADALTASVGSGQLTVGDALPPAEQIAIQAGVSLSTARRAVRLLKDRGTVASVGGRPVLTAAAQAEAFDERIDAAPRWVRTEAVDPAGNTYWMATLRGPGGLRSGVRMICGSLTNPDGFRQHLIGIARIEDPAGTDAGDSWIGRYELELRPAAGGGEVVVLRW